MQPSPLPRSRSLPRPLALPLLLFLAAPAAHAQATLTADRIITGVSDVAWVGSPPTDGRIFVVEQNTADVKVYTAAGGSLGTFLNLTGSSSGAGVTVQTTGERGLLSLAFDPDYASNGFFYVYYTAAVVGSRIERYRVLGNPLTSNTADPSSATTILQQPQPFSNHNGGNLQFGQDGYLYFAFGDGGDGGDPNCYAQKGDTWLGKMLRLDVRADDFPGDPTRNYAIPSDNPFVGDPSVMDEIYHLGLRNPWRWSFDPHTGDMYIGDVGQGSLEEIDFAPAGLGGVNFGWKIMEGTNCFGTGNCPAGTPSCGSPALTLPIHEYSLSGTPCAVMGGVVYRGCTIPEEYGTYFFADHCSNAIWSFSYDPIQGLTGFANRTAELTSSFGISSVRTFGHDFKGEVLIGDQNEVFRVRAVSRSFVPDVCTLSVSAGGAQNWLLDAGGSAGGDIYFVGGSLSGIAGIPLGPVVVPLSGDFYTLYSLAHPNEPPLIDSFGVLDGGGEASARFATVGGVLPVSLVGTQAYHAYAVLDGSLGATFASNPISLFFNP
jgi:glucose/arabinose dehydrogenase